MNSFNLEINTIEKQVYSGPAVYCKIITPVGSKGIEARHEEFNAILEENTDIVFRTESEELKTVTIKSAILSFKNNTCTIVAEINK